MAWSSSATRMVEGFMARSSSDNGRDRHGRQEDAEDGAPRLAVELDDAAMVADDLRHQGEAETGAVALGGDEGVEEMGAQIFRDALAVVADGDDERQVDTGVGARHGKPHPLLVGG